jgi:polar amino acid transport system substrate-binding protein
MTSIEKGILIFLWSFFSVFFTFGQSIDEIYFMTEYYPPFNYYENDHLQGISVDLLVSILDRLESIQTRQDIHLVPWARGYSQLLNNRNTSLFSITRSEEREDKFKWVGPIYSNTISVIARKDRNIRINSVEELKKYEICSVIEDIGEQLLVEAGIELDSLNRIGGVTVLYQGIRMLDLGRVDLFAYDEDVLNWELREKGIDSDDYETVYILKKSELHYAFHIETVDSLTESFQSALDDLKEDGTYQIILDRYLNSPNDIRKDLLFLKEQTVPQ